MPARLWLVHGLTGSKDHPQVVALATKIRARGFDVISYDARGHGSSGGISTLGKILVSSPANRRIPLRVRALDWILTTGEVSPISAQ